MCTMSRRLVGELLRRHYRVDGVRRKQRLRPTVMLGMAIAVFILLCAVACGGGSDASLAKSGINMVVVSGQARIQSGERNTLVVEGQEAVIAAGDQLVADETGVRLLLADGSLLYLSPDTDLQAVTFSAKGMVRLSQSQGTLEVEAASPLLTVEISISTSDAFVMKTTQLTATPTVRDTSFRLWIEGVNAFLNVEAGEVKVTGKDRTVAIPAGGEVEAIPGEELIVSQIEAPAGPTVLAAVTSTDLVPTITSDLIHSTPTVTATATVAPSYLYPAPGLTGPADGSKFTGGETILLIWDTSMTLSEDEWYEVQLWQEGEVPYRVVQRVKEGAWKVEGKYYPGRYQWRILIVRGQEDHKEVDLSPPSQTWGFDWLRPSVPVSTAPTAPSVSGASVDFTVYLRGTNNAQGFATFGSGRVDAGSIYDEGGYIYGDVAVRIGDTVYHFDKPKPAPGEPEQLPAPYRMEFKFSDPLVNVAEGQPGFNSQKAQFWVGELDCSSANPPDKPYKIEMTLYAGGETRRQAEVSFFVADVPLCGGEGGEPDEGGGGPAPPPRP